ncbi:MAG: hypothetical protein CMJ77_02995 [Planctomycetaceae bacterium]|nr:hypothetical protein [Planctomycetaceae bacterium]
MDFNEGERSDGWGFYTSPSQRCINFTTYLRTVSHLKLCTVFFVFWIDLRLTDQCSSTKMYVENLNNRIQPLTFAHR